MAGSSTPPIRSCLWTTRSGPASTMAAENYDSSEDESSIEIPKPASLPRPIPRSVSRSISNRIHDLGNIIYTSEQFMFYVDQVGYGAFLSTSLNMPSHAKGFVQVFAYRQLLQVGIKRCYI